MIVLLISFDQSAILNSFSTIIGALIAGAIGFIVAKFDIKSKEKQIKIEEIHKFFKIYYVLNPLLERITILLNEPYDKEQERYPTDLIKETLINHMHGHLSNEHNSKHSANKEKYQEIVFYHLKQIIETRDVLMDIKETVINLKDDYIPYEFYKTYQDIIYTLKKLIDFTDKFLYHDEDIPKDEFQKTLNLFHDNHGNNKVIQHRLVESDMYSQYVDGIYQYKKELEQLFNQKRVELKRLEK